MLSVRVPKQLKELVDADRRSNQDVVEASLWAEFGGEPATAIERQIEETEKRICVVEEERDTRDSELEELRERLDELKRRKEAADESKSVNGEELYRKVRQVPKEPDHPLVQDVAEELDKEPTAVIQEAYDQ